MPGRLTKRLERLVRRALGTPLAVPIRTAYDALIASEIGIARLLARRRRRPPYAGGDVTVVMKTFERPDLLGRMLASLAQVFAGPVLVADDSRDPVRTTQHNVTVLTMPFDSGIGAGRNLLLGHVATEFVLMCDDDFILLPDFDIARAVAFLRRHQDVDVHAGRVVNLPHLRNVDYSHQALLAQRGTPKVRQGTLVEGLPVLYKVPNFYLARTASIRSIGYDSRLKRVDHNDFFTSGYGRLVCVQDRSWYCLHAHSIFHEYYQSYRLDMAADFAYLAQKWGGAGGQIRRADTELTADQRTTIHWAAIERVARDVGLGVHRVAVDHLRIGTDRPDELAEALTRVGWSRQGAVVRHDLWGRAVLERADSQPAASQPRLASEPDLTGPPRIVRSTRAAWIDEDARLLGACLPSGPVIVLEPPADLIWEIIGESGATRDAVATGVLAHFENPPDEAAGQVQAVLDDLIRVGLLDAIGDVAEIPAAEAG